MIETNDIVLRNIILHKVSSNDDLSVYTNAEIEILKDEDYDVLKKMFIKPFLNQILTYEFNHEVDNDYNVLFNLAKKIHENENFVELSCKIALHLSSISKHYSINDGDLFVVKFESIKLNNTFYEGLGIYKYDEKENFVETNLSKNNMEINFKKGIGGKKPDKACMVIFTEKPYTILVLDNNNTDYWQSDFIKVKSKNDAVNYTNDFLSITKNYLTKQFSEDFNNVEKTDKIDLLNRSVEYFKNKEVFDRKEFESEVLQDENLVESFQNYKQNYEQQNDVKIEDSFEISTQAVKKQARVFKSVLKLDKNFHIYIHGNKEMIEKGVDEQGRKFYKIYYQDEE